MWENGKRIGLGLKLWGQVLVLPDTLSQAFGLTETQF